MCGGARAAGARAAGAPTPTARAARDTISVMQTFAAAILAGGASRRMGTPKALMPFSEFGNSSSKAPEDKAPASKPLIAHVADVLRPLFGSVVVVTSSQEFADACGLPAVGDKFQGKGPMAGIHAALAHFNTQGETAKEGESIDRAPSGTPVFCVACDMPHLNAAFISYLLEQWSDCDAVVPRIGAYDEPLHAIYGAACLPVIERELAREHVGPVDNIFGDLRVRFVGEEEARRFDPALRLFDNWNTPDDVKKSRGQ